jgi:hypothetical protein
MQVRTYHLCDDELHFKLAAMAAGHTRRPVWQRPEYGSRIPRPPPPARSAPLPPQAGQPASGIKSAIPSQGGVGGSYSPWF